MSDREEFERWAENQEMELTTWGGGYLWKVTKSAWEAWQAATAGSGEADDA